MAVRSWTGEAEDTSAVVAVASAVARKEAWSRSQLEYEYENDRWSSSADEEGVVEEVVSIRVAKGQIAVEEEVERSSAEAYGGAAEECFALDGWHIGKDVGNAAVVVVEYVYSVLMKMKHRLSA